MRYWLLPKCLIAIHTTFGNQKEFNISFVISNYTVGGAVMGCASQIETATGQIVSFYVLFEKSDLKSLYAL